jgi:tape measure domain-containing protein
MGGAENAAAMVDKLNEFTASTPFRLEQVSRSARQLIAVGVGVDDITDSMRMLGDIAAASGNQIEDIAAIFAKVQAKGKVDLEALNQMAERGIPIFDELRKVTGDANMEFGAGKVSVDDFNTALENMAGEGGFADGAMKNLSETVEGKLSTALDNASLAMGKFAESSGLLETITNALDDMTGQVQRMSATEDDLVQSRSSVYDISVKLRSAHKGNIAALLEEADAAKDVAFALKQNLGTDAAAAHFKGAKAMYDRALEAFSMAGTHLSTLPDAPSGGKTDPPKETIEQFTERFNAAAAVTEETKRLTEATAQQIVTDEGLIEAQQGLRDAYGQVGGTIREVLMDEEELFDEDDQERIAEGTRLLRNAALAAGNIGAAMSVTSALTNAAFESIKEGGKSFGESVLAMLESLLKKAIALAAAFAAMSLIGGPGFADGGLVTGATLAMVGEGPGTSLSNPEVIAPLDKLQSMMGGGNVNVTGVIRGQDILISNERSALDRNRVRGF